MYLKHMFPGILGQIASLSFSHPYVTGYDGETGSKDSCSALFCPRIHYATLDILVTKERVLSRNKCWSQPIPALNFKDRKCDIVQQENNIPKVTKSICTNN